MSSRAHIAIIVVALIVAAAPAAAQSWAPTLDLSAGWIGFADDGIVSEAPIGAGARWYLTPRVSVGPEFTHIFADRHSHQVLTGNLTFEFVRPAPGKVIPFVVVGGGMFRTSESFGQGTYSSTEGAFTVGGGVRVAVTDRVSLGVDARLGWEPHLRVVGVAGIRLGS